MIEAEDIPELRDADRRQPMSIDDWRELDVRMRHLFMEAFERHVDRLEAERAAKCKLAHLHDILISCPECGLEA